MIFANVRAKNASGDADPDTLRISVDTKATVNVGDYSRGGKSRGRTADGILLWWKKRQQELSRIRHLVINMDNSPECNGRRSQFLYRMAEFAYTTGLNTRESS